MTFDIKKFKETGLDVGIRPALFEFVPKDNSNLKYLISRVHLSFSTATDNVMDRVIKMSMLENDNFDAFHWLISLGPNQLNASLNSYRLDGTLIKEFPVGFKIDSFHSTFDWEKPDEILRWSVAGKINFIS